MSASFILLVLVFNINQSYQRSDKVFPAVAMQEFSSKEACLFAQKQLQVMANEESSKLRMTCVPKHHLSK